MSDPPRVFESWLNPSESQPCGLNQLPHEAKRILCQLNSNEIDKALAGTSKNEFPEALHMMLSPKIRRELKEIGFSLLPKFAIFPGLEAVEWTRVDMAELDRQGLDMKQPLDQSKLAPDFTFGGYLEDRTQLWDGFEPGMARMVHLGVDISAPPGQIVTAPRKGVVVDVLRDRTPFNGWGGRIILEMPSEDPFRYLLLGHLHPDRLRVITGQVLEKGDPVGELGPPGLNGGWFPHLHIQQMSWLWKDLDGYAETALEWVCDPVPLISS